MAIIREFEQLELKANARHTETKGGYSVQGQDGEKFTTTGPLQGGIPETDIDQM